MVIQNCFTVSDTYENGVYFYATFRAEKVCIYYIEDLT